MKTDDSFDQNPETKIDPGNAAVDAIGFFGDGIIGALSIITAILATRSGVAAEVRDDLELALQEMIRKPFPVDGSNAIAQHALQQSIALLIRSESYFPASK